MRLSSLLLLYFTLRVFSFVFPPETPLVSQHWLNTLVSLIILALTAFLLWRRDERGWFIVAGEMILGGAGGYLAFEGVALRTLLLLVSMSIFVIQEIKCQISNVKCQIDLWRGRLTSPIFYLIIIIPAIAGISALRGYFNGHDTRLIIADTLPYLFFLYVFPLIRLLYPDSPASQQIPSPPITATAGPRLMAVGRGTAEARSFKQFAWNAITAAIIGNAALILFTFIGFSSGIFELQDAYYHWYRDVALGKITNVGLGFYRLVLNEHLLLVPLILILLSSLLNRQHKSQITNHKSQISTKDQKTISRIGNWKLGFDWKLEIGNWKLKTLLKNKFNIKDKTLHISIFFLLVVLSINLTRIYMLALLVGLLMLYNKYYWKRWLLYSAATLATLVISFTAIHLVASRGQSLGWELFGLRLQSVVAPNIEESSLSRMLLLPKILDKIKSQPILGTGLGDTVTVYSPVIKQDITTSHFDWGYLEIMAEMGVVGLLVWLLLIVYLIFRYFNISILNNDITKLRNYKINNRLLLAPLASLLIINITSPALFHVMGIVYLTILLVCANIPCSFDNLAKLESKVDGARPEPAN